MDFNIESSKIQMSQEFYDLKLDLFQIGEINFLWYVSPNFVNAIEENGLTGLEFEEFDL